jgi:hypothetical protein
VPAPSTAAAAAAAADGAIRRQQDEEYAASLAADQAQAAQHAAAGHQRAMLAALRTELLSQQQQREQEREQQAGQQGGLSSGSTAAQLLLRVRLPDGSHASRSFADGQAFDDVMAWVFVSLPAAQATPPGDWRLVSAFPRLQLAPPPGSLWSRQGWQRWLQRQWARGRALSAQQAAAGTPGGSWLLEVRRLDAGPLRLRVCASTTILQVQDMVQAQTGARAQRCRVPGDAVTRAHSRTALHAIAAQWSSSLAALAHMHTSHPGHTRTHAHTHAGLAPHEQRLIFGGKVVPSHRCLADLGIAEGHVLTLTQPLPQSVSPPPPLCTSGSGGAGSSSSSIDAELCGGDSPMGVTIPFGPPNARVSGAVGGRSGGGASSSSSSSSSAAAAGGRGDLLGSCSAGVEPLVAAEPGAGAGAAGGGGALVVATVRELRAAVACGAQQVALFVASA